MYLVTRSIVILRSGGQTLRPIVQRDGSSVIMLQFRKLSIHFLSVLGWLLSSLDVCLGSFYFLLFRACVGRNLASMELLIIVASIMRRYDIILESPDQEVCLKISP